MPSNPVRTPSQVLKALHRKLGGGQSLKTFLRALESPRDLVAAWLASKRRPNAAPLPPKSRPIPTQAVTPAKVFKKR